MAKISVIIPAYNRAHCIARAIQSVLAQTLPVTEIIVVDDGSTDGTAELAQSHFGSTIRVLRHPTNLGAAAARNTGMSAVSVDCDYIAWLDSDDEWLPEKLEKQVAVLNASPSVVAVCSAYKMIENRQESNYIPDDRSPWAEGLLLGCDVGPGATLLVRREAALATGLLDTRLTRYEDWDWLLRLAQKFEMTLISTPLAKVHRGGWPRPEIVETAIEQFIRKHQADFDALGQQRSRRALSRMWLDGAWFAYNMHPRNCSLERFYFWKALRISFIQPPGVYLGFLDSLLGTRWSLRLHFAAQFSHMVRLKLRGRRLIHLREGSNERRG